MRGEYAPEGGGYPCLSRPYHLNRLQKWVGDSIPWLCQDPWGWSIGWDAQSTAGDFLPQITAAYEFILHDAESSTRKMGGQRDKLTEGD